MSSLATEQNSIGARCSYLQDGELFLSNVDDDPKKIIDIGTGIGEYSEKY
jgi:hypothetical protein